MRRPSDTLRLVLAGLAITAVIILTQQIPDCGGRRHSAGDFDDEAWTLSMRPGDRLPGKAPLPHVFQTTDLGLTWTPIAGNLPEAPANDIAFDPTDESRLFVATDVGVFETWDGGTMWSALGPDLPNVVVTMLAIDPVSRRLTAATYGRSLFSYQIDQSSGVEPALGRLDSRRRASACPLGSITFERAPGTRSSDGRR